METLNGSKLIFYKNTTNIKPDRQLNKNCSQNWNLKFMMRRLGAVAGLGQHSSKLLHHRPASAPGSVCTSAVGFGRPATKDTKGKEGPVGRCGGGSVAPQGYHKNCACFDKNCASSSDGEQRS